MNPIGTRWLRVVEEGLPATPGPRQRVVIVGAGIAGLVAAHELLRAGHDPLILESQHRVGGRILTLREPFTPGLYGEAGAMRIPRTHALTVAYVEKFGLKLNPFMLQNPEAYCHLFGRKHRWREIDADPALLAGENERADRGTTCTSGGSSDPPARRGDRAGRRNGLGRDRRTLLRLLDPRIPRAAALPEPMIELFACCRIRSADELGFSIFCARRSARFYVDLLQIEGGMDLLPRAFLPALASRIRFGARMTTIEATDAGVTIHYQTVGGRGSASGDYAIVTVPFPVLRHVEVVHPFSSAKRRAIRQLRYDASAKIFLQFRRRFWEEDEGIAGGGTVTDYDPQPVLSEHGSERGRGVSCE